MISSLDKKRQAVYTKALRNKSVLLSAWSRLYQKSLALAVHVLLWANLHINCIDIGINAGFGVLEMFGKKRISKFRDVHVHWYLVYTYYEPKQKLIMFTLFLSLVHARFSFRLFIVHFTEEIMFTFLSTKVHVNSLFWEKISFMTNNEPLDVRMNFFELNELMLSDHRF